MGKPGQPKRVLFFIATLFKDEEIYYLTRRIIVECFGETILESAKKYWDYSKYYSAEAW